MSKVNRFSPEVRERAVRLVGEHAGGEGSQWAAIQSMAAKIGCSAETLRSWVRQAERDRGERSELTTSEREELKALQRENRELKKANEILRLASAYFTKAELDLRKGPQVLHVPAMAGRYYSPQFTDPAKSSNFAYVGTRTTGTEAGEYLLCKRAWKGTVPKGMTRIPSPTNCALVIGRLFVANEGDQPVAYALAKQIRLTPS